MSRKSNQAATEVNRRRAKNRPARTIYVQENPKTKLIPYTVSGIWCLDEATSLAVSCGYTNIHLNQGSDMFPDGLWSCYVQATGIDRAMSVAEKAMRDELAAAMASGRADSSAAVGTIEHVAGCLKEALDESDSDVTDRAERRGSESSGEVARYAGTGWMDDDEYWMRTGAIGSGAAVLYSSTGRATTSRSTGRNWGRWKNNPNPILTAFSVEAPAWATARN